MQRLLSTPKLLKLFLMPVMLFIFSVPCATEEKINNEQQGEIGELINQLSSNELKTREESQNKLLAIGKKLITEYQDQKGDGLKSQIKIFAEVLSNACRSEDAEIKNRADQIRRYCYYLTQPKIVFSSKRGGISGIYIMSMDGSNLKKLTDDKSHGFRPACSPDGKRIIFLSKGIIYVMDIDGKNKKQLLDNEKISVFNLLWSPDGTKIAFSSWSQDSISQIYIMDADGKNMKQLTQQTDQAFIQSFSWSPDGTKIAFDYWHENLGDPLMHFKVYVMDADGKNLKCLSSGTQFNNENPIWNPDGTKIAFSSYSHQHDKYDICIMNADGSNQKKLIDNEASINIAPCWSPDGTKIVFMSKLNDKDKYNLYLIDADGKKQTNLTKNQLDDLDFLCRPDWSPDGKKILLATEKSDNRDIYIIDVEGENLKQLTNNGTVNLWITTWCPSLITNLSAFFSDDH